MPPSNSVKNSPAPIASSGDSSSESNEHASVTELVTRLSDAISGAIGEISAVNAETKLLSLNARIESARAGDRGAAFNVVAEEMQTLSNRTEDIANDMRNRTQKDAAQLVSLIDSTIRGTRLGDLSLVNIDLIDRNLYERTCDVRWWATDGSLVNALTNPNEETIRFVTKRLGVILDAYTVYYDLVLCDAAGNVIANGRPRKYANLGMNQANEPWFKLAKATRSGDEYGFQTVHQSSLVDKQESLIYSAAVRANGESNGAVLGALGIVFDWPELASPIMQNIPVLPNEQSTTEAYIIDRDGRILSSRDPSDVGQTLRLPQMERVFESEKDFYVATLDGKSRCIGHAKAPGFETYSTGWYSIVSQPIDSAK